MVRKTLVAMVAVAKAGGDNAAIDHQLWLLLLLTYSQARNSSSFGEGM